MGPLKKNWLALENWISLNKGVIFIVLYFLFFFVFPFFVSDRVDFDAISATIP